MDHRLFVAALVIAQRAAGLVQGLADAGDVAVAEDAEHAGEERLLPAVAFAALRARNRTSACAIVDARCIIDPDSESSRRARAREIIARAEKLPQRAPGRREIVELVDGEPIWIVGAPEIGEARVEIVDDARLDRRVDARPNRRCRWRRSASATPAAARSRRRRRSARSSACDCETPRYNRRVR